MIRHSSSSLLWTALSLSLLPRAIAVGHGDTEAPTMSAGDMVHAVVAVASHPLEVTDPSYFRLKENSVWMYGHILVMTVTWVILLPLASVFSVAQSRFALPTQIVFLFSNAIGLFLGTVYNAKTPDLYEHNAHHKVGWVFTWIVAAWVILGVVNGYVTRFANGRHNYGQQMSIDNLTRYSCLQNAQDSSQCRWSRDSGQGTEHDSASLCDTGSPLSGCDQPFEELPMCTYEESREDVVEAEDHWPLEATQIDRFVSHIMQPMTGRVLAVSKVIYIIFERALVVLGSAALLSGAATYGGLFRDSAVFNGLAHWIKGGIFFWYGLLTLGRWMGSYADFGWAWNLKPGHDLVPRWKTRMPSAEFVESSVIAVYGITNVWLEHLAAWGSEWAPEDLEHLSITILFFGGGALGMMIESTWIRELLSTHIVTVHEDAKNHAASIFEEEAWKQPSNYRVVLNPMPALVILLLGIMMSSHNQESMTSSMIHKQWGQLFVGYAIARGCTYLLMYVKPCTSYLPSRPPSEIVTSFCLVSGGLIFMASARDVVVGMEYNQLDPMFCFTLTMGLTALLLAWTILLLTIKGWAVRKEKPHLARSHFGASQQLDA